MDMFNLEERGVKVSSRNDLPGGALRALPWVIAFSAFGAFIASRVRNFCGNIGI
jgi:hypothetical protein